MRPMPRRPRGAMEMIRVNTLRYEATHGHKPRQPHGASMSPWAFVIDQQPVPVIITASYKDALKKAKSRARWSVVVLP
jgi:hypothetical protein